MDPMGYRTSWFPKAVVPISQKCQIWTWPTFQKVKQGKLHMGMLQMFRPTMNCRYEAGMRPVGPVKCLKTQGMIRKDTELRKQSAFHMHQ